MTITCLIIDDEPLAIGLLESFVRQTNFLRLKKTFSNAVEALTFLNQEAVDLVFLDIQMPELSGMELARLLDAKPAGQKPKIIFTTAYNEFAVEGYKVEAIDYLLKPFSYEEFHRAAGKVYQYFEEREVPAAQAKGAAAVPSSPDYIFLKVEYQVIKVNKSAITHIEAYKDYVKVHLKEKSAPILSLTSMKNMEDLLCQDNFMRIHRSTILNLDHIDAVSKNTVHVGEHRLPVSDLYKEAFMDFLTKWMG